MGPQSLCNQTLWWCFLYCHFAISVGIRDFVMGLHQISSFFSLRVMIDVQVCIFSEINRI